MTTDWIFGWWNLVVLAPFLLALIYLGVYAASGLTFGDADADAGADHDFGADADHDLGADADHDLGADADADHDLGADADHDVAADADADADADAEHDAGDGHAVHANANGHSSLFTALTWLGVGRVPLSIVLMVLLLSWGAIGFSVNVLSNDLFAGEPWRLVILSLPAAFAGSLLVTGGISKAIVKLIPLNETSARRRHELLGSVGEAIYNIEEASGVIAVRDENGDLCQVAGRVEAGKPPILKGSRVKLVAYDAPRKLFFARTVNGNNEPAAAAGDAKRIPAAAAKQQ
jgi:hypothetical protein